MLEIIIRRLTARKFVIPAGRHRHFCKKLLMIIVAINLTFFTATSLADNVGTYGTRANNGTNHSSNLQLKNHITSTVNYYIRSSDENTCLKDGTLGSGTLPAATTDSTTTTVSSDIVDNSGNVVFCTTCGDTEEDLVYHLIKHDGCDHDVYSPEDSNLTSDDDCGYLHMNIYCDDGGACNDWGDESGCS